jgi:putative membrane protein
MVLTVEVPMRSRLLPVVALALLTSCSPDNPRRDDETGMALPSAAGDSTSRGAGAPGPSAILSQLYISHTREIQLSKLAAMKASSPKVKRVANKLAADHAKNREEERALAQKLNVALTPAAGGEKAAGNGAGLPPELQGKTGLDFDKAFVEHEIKEHEVHIEKLQNQLLPATQNAEMKAYLQRTLGAIEGHLADLKQVQQQLG